MAEGCFGVHAGPERAFLHKRTHLHKCINMILDIRAGEAPCNPKGDYWQITTVKTMMPDRVRTPTNE